MTAIVKKTSGELTIPVDVQETYRQLKLQKKEIEDAIKNIESAIIDLVETKQIPDKDDLGTFRYAYVPAGERETFDTKKFREENPEIYDEYVRFSPTKSSVRITTR